MDYIKRELTLALKMIVPPMVLECIIAFVCGLYGIYLSDAAIGILWVVLFVVSFVLVSIAESGREEKQKQQAENDKISGIMNSTNPAVARKYNEVAERAVSGQYANPAQKMADMAWLGAALGDIDLATRFYQQLAGNTAR